MASHGMVNRELFSTTAMLRDIGKGPVVSQAQSITKLLCLDGSHDLQWEGQITKRTNLFHKPDQSSVAVMEVIACICLLLFVEVTYDFLN